MPAALEHVGRGIRVFAATVEPEEGTVLTLTSGSGGRRVFHPALGEHAQVPGLPVIQIQLPEFGKVPRRHVQVGRPHGRPAHIRLEARIADSQGLENLPADIGEEFGVGGESAPQVAHDDIRRAAGIIPIGPGLVLQGLGEGVEAHVLVLQSLYSEHSIGGVIDRQQNMLFRKSESGLGRQTIYVYLHHQKIILAHRQLCILSSLHYSMGKPRRHTNRHQKERNGVSLFLS